LDSLKNVGFGDRVKIQGMGGVRKSLD